MNSERYENRVFKDLKITEKTVEGCEFMECTFDSCTFEDCKIIRNKFIDCQFNSCTVISPRSKYSEMRHSEFTNCNLIGIHWAEFFPVGQIFEPIRRMNNCYLKYNTFIHMNFRKFDFSKNQMENSMFEECNLMECKFRNCRLTATQILKCDIRKADFRDAGGYQIDITTNQLKGAKFSFPEVINLLSQLEITID
ncbi:pentapeptide repeat-containing protein [Ruminococcus gauvreauii]|uniref:pentapeptide repeat-containing protein n=1 Tax=Ruminococcus gauvreauii TaxID=438033 RepID=UPI0039845BFC